MSLRENTDKILGPGFASVRKVFDYDRALGIMAGVDGHSDAYRCDSSVVTKPAVTEKRTRNVLIGKIMDDGELRDLYINEEYDHELEPAEVRFLSDDEIEKSALKALRDKFQAIVDAGRVYDDYLVPLQEEEV